MIELLERIVGSHVNETLPVGRRRRRPPSNVADDDNDNESVGRGPNPPNKSPFLAHLFTWDQWSDFSPGCPKTADENAGHFHVAPVAFESRVESLRRCIRSRVC